MGLLTSNSFPLRNIYKCPSVNASLLQGRTPTGTVRNLHLLNHPTSVEPGTGLHYRRASRLAGYQILESGSKVNLAPVFSATSTRHERLELAGTTLLVHAGDLAGDLRQ